jgi:hypothetical protein
MVSERLKNELAALRAKMLDIREFDSSSPEHLKCLCESIQNIQAVLTEMVQQQSDAHVPHVPAEAVPSPDATHDPVQVAA